jgi:hypothetical protein
MQDGMVAQITLMGSEPESQNHKLALYYLIHQKSQGLPESQNHKRSRWGLRVTIAVFYT